MFFRALHVSYLDTLRYKIEKIYIYFFSRGPHTKLFGLIIRKDGIILVALSSQSAPHR
jgi:hypothetical protein